MTQVSESGSGRTLGVQRELFDIPEDIIYLNCANMSPQLRAVTAAGLQAVRAKAAPWMLGARDWFSGAERLRALFARIVNADQESIALVPSVSYGIAIAAANVPVGRGQSILLLDQEFPSNVYAWRALAERRVARVRTVRREAGATWTQALVDAIDDRTAVVAVSSCHWTDGASIDLERVGIEARRAGAALVVDASQSLGAYPLDVTRVRPDFLVTVGYKWLLGPYGLGYLYVAPRWRERGIPIEQSWLTREGSENFARLVDYTDTYRPGARRFDMGEFPQFVLAPMATAALEQILSWGVERIRDTLSTLTARVALAANTMGGSTTPAAHRVGHMIGIRLAGGLSDGIGEEGRGRGRGPESVGSAFAAAKVYVSIRGDSIRVAPHLYNDQRDLDRFLAVLERCTRPA
jgi:selenocysteine lyase/cysteine desulfurase